MKRIAHPRTAGAVLALVVAVCVLFSTVSNAAGLQLIAQSGGVFAQTTARCTDGPLTVEPSDTADANGEHSVITVSGPMGSCTGGDVIVYRTDSPHTIEFSASGTVSGGELVVTSDPFKPLESGHEVVVRLNGWIIPAEWKYTAPEPEPEDQPVVPGNPNTTILDMSWTVQNNNSAIAACFTAQVTSASLVPVPWELLIVYPFTPWGGASTGYSMGGGYVYTANSPSPGLGRVAPGGEYDWVSVGVVRDIKVCHHGLQPLPDTPSAYTYSVVNGVGAKWSSSQACRTATVSGNGTESNWFFRWAMQLDMGPAIDRLGGTPDRYGGEIDDTTKVLFSPNRSAKPRVFSVVTNPNTTHAALRGTQTFQYEVCVYKD